MPTKPWQEVAQRAQAYRDDTIAAITSPIPAVPKDLPQNVTKLPKELLTPREVEITEYLPEELLPALANSKLSSVEVTNAFLRRAGLAQQLANCVTEVLAPQALKRAKFCDEYLAKHGKPIGPLHGLPISVKEHIGMKGLTQNCGFVAWIDEVAKEDAFILTLLHDAGAVFYVRTTEPQLLMHLETSSNLYGVTVNPYNRALTSGGSSGGEGALLGLKGSCLGIGTDIGGSIRSPAANNGVWGFRPSSYRLPTIGAHAPGLGEEQIIPVIGPLATSLAGLNMFMKTIIDQKPWLKDPSMIPLKWNTNESHLVQKHGQKKLKVAVMWHDGIVKPHPPVTRALTEMVEKLKKVPGIRIVDWVPHKHDESWDIISSLYFCAGAKEDSDILEAGGEPFRPLSKFILLEQVGVPKEEDTASIIWKKTVRREAFKADYAAHWNSTGSADGHPVDVILCPVGPGAAPPLDHARYWAYTSIWNLLDYPAMVFPYCQVDQAKDKVEEGYEPMNEQDDWNYKLYSPERYADAPVSLQLVGRRYEDEKVFEAMELIKVAVGL